MAAAVAERRGGAADSQRSTVQSVIRDLRNDIVKTKQAASKKIDDYIAGFPKDIQDKLDRSIESANAEVDATGQRELANEPHRDETGL